jgi:hypothetical protein
MRDEHIKRMLDEAPLSILSKAELAAVRAHAEGLRRVPARVRGGASPRR